MLAALLVFAGVLFPVSEKAGAAGPVVVETRVALGADDAEERSSGDPSLTSSDLELVRDESNGDQVIGIRFTAVGVPQGAQIDNVYVQFQVDETSSELTTLTLRAEAIDNASGFTGTDFEVSSRTLTTASVTWSPPAWNTVGEAGPDQRTPNLAALVQELVDRPGWLPGNAMAFIVSGSGKRVAEAYDGIPSAAPLLHIEYSQAVSVDAKDDTATEGASADDGVFRFTRTGPTDQAMTVTYMVAGTAYPDADYMALTGVLAISAGEQWADVVVTPFDDAVVEGSETVVVTVVEGPDYVAGSFLMATVTILDDETPTVSVSAEDGVAIEGADPPNTAAFLFTRSGPVEQELSVDYTVAGLATPGVDYSALSGSVTIAAGATTGTVVVDPLDDLLSEGTEAVSVTVVDGAGYVAVSPVLAVVTIVDNDPILEIQIAASTDDAEEDSSGDVSRSSGALEIVSHPTLGDQTVGLRFGVPVPRGATITDAWVQFQVDTVSVDPITLLIEGEAVDDAAPFTNTAFDISSRARTDASVIWSPAAWDVTRVAGPDQRTPDLSTVIQEIVDRPGWASGRSLSLVITGSGLRVAESSDGDPSAAPVLHVEYAGTGVPVNQAPLVEARADSVVYPTAVVLDGSVSDDLLPDPPGAVTTIWSLVSGPGTVTFADESAIDTTATFSGPGIYEISLTADDGELTATDSILFTTVDPDEPAVSSVQFAAFGDYGTAGEAAASVASMVAIVDPDFIITTGDNRYVNDIDQAIGKFYSGYIGNYQGDYGPGSPINRFFPALGNHDYSEFGGLPVYLDYFSLPGGAMPTSSTSGNERYYDFIRGPVHFFAINSDPEELDGRSSTSVQAQWLEAQLAASTSPWQIVYFHHAPFSSSDHGPTTKMQWPFQAWGADAVLAAHDHDYERLTKDGIPYFVVGSGGAGLDQQNNPIDPDSQFFYGADHGALIIDACSERLAFEFRSVSEGVVDSYAVGAASCLAVNDPPVATDDSASTSEDTLANVDVLANDTDVDDPTLTVTNLIQPSNGTAVVEVNNTITYTPDPDFNGVDSFTYTANDGTTDSNTATVTITVTPVNDPPVASDDTATTTEDTAVNVDVLANDTDVDGNLDLTSVNTACAGCATPTNGSLINNGDGTFGYTPDLDFNGSDSFTYEICDTDGLCDTATVLVTVGAVNDPPVASDDSASTNEDTPVNVDVLANDTDVDDPTLTVTNLIQPSNGTAVVEVNNTITYTPDPDFNGTDTFTYTANDGFSDSNVATVSITVSPANDPPVANDDTAVTSQNTAVVIDVTVNDTDVDGDVLGATNLGVPSNGSVIDNGDETITYTPNLDFNGSDSFTYTANDGVADSNTATVTVTVTAVNDPPVANGDSAATDEDSAVNVDVLANDSDADGNLDPSSLQVTVAPSNGSTQIETDDTITYTPNPDYNGSDSFTYEICDTLGACDTAAVLFTINPVNDAPVAVDDSAATDEDTGVSVDVLANDTDVDDPTLTVTNLVQPSNGTAVVEADDTVTYTPDPDFNGADSFTYTANDTDADSNVATVSITVNPVNDPPVASDDTTSTSEDTPVLFEVVSNDTDVDANIDTTTVNTDCVGCSYPSGGLNNHGDGTFTYTPVPDYYGSDTFTYQICDTGGLCDTAVVSITVSPVNDPPSAVDDTTSTSEDTPVNVDAAANDTDLDGNLDPSTVTVTSPPANGTTNTSGDGTITYTPNPGYTGTDAFTYQICDLDGLCDTAIVTVTVGVGTVEQFAQSENTVVGSVSGGSLTDTYTSDGVLEELTEKRSGGPRQSRQSFLDHRWSFFIERGDSIDVMVEAFHSPNAEGDDFAFEYSVDGGATFLPLFVVTATDTPTPYSATLPPDTSGNVLIRVMDTDQTPGNASTDTVFVDLLVIRTTNPLPSLPEVTVTASDSAASEAGDTGTFTVRRNDSSGSLTVFYTVAGTATGGSDYEALAGSVSFVDGQTEALITVTPIDDNDSEGDESVDMNLSPGVEYSLGTPITATVIIADDEAIGSESRALSEDSVYGSVVSGSYQSTHFADGASEVIEEELYAGNKRSRLKHQWTFDVATGSTVTFFLLANQIGSEDFAFSYSTDGSNWTDMLVGASGTQESFVLPSGTQGTLFVRVVDDDRSRNETTIDTIRIDEMYFQSTP